MSLPGLPRLQEPGARTPNKPRMKLTLLGTAAAEGWPAPFCRCDACRQARLLGGRNIRSRSGALVDGDLKIDWGPDTVSQIQRLGLDLAGLRTLIFTHQHCDHIVASELEWTTPPSTLTPPAVPIAVYGNAPVLAMLRAEFPNPAAQNLELHLLEPLVPVVTPTGDEVLPLPARHAPQALLLRLTRGGRHLLYGHDTGLFPDETIAALAGTPLHAALFDCTLGGVHSGYRGHMDIEEVLQTIERLRSVGTITQETTLVATHFSHNGALLHEALVERFAPHGVRVAYDGLVITV